MTNRIPFNPYNQFPASNMTTPISKGNAQQKSDKYHSTAQQAYHTASEIGRKKDTCEQLITETNTKGKHSDNSVTAFKDLVGVEIFNQVCSDLAVAKNGNRSQGDQLTGYNLLRENFLAILGLKDAHGKNPLNKILEKLTREHEAYQAIAEINTLAPTLILLQCTGKESKDFSQLESIAIDKFKNLPPKAKNALCQYLSELNQKFSSSTHGYDTALQDIRILLYYQNTCPIDDCLKELEKETKIPYEFKDCVLHNQQILISDPHPVIQDIIKIYQLEELRGLLSDTSQNNDRLVSKYNALNGDLKKMLGEIIFIASYEPSGRNGESLLGENMSVLIRSKNKEGVDVLSQLVSHYSEKVKIQRLNAEIDSFVKQCTGHSNNHNSIIQKFNHLSHDAKEGLRAKVWWYHGGKDNPNFGWWGYGTNKIDENGCNLTYSYLGTNNKSLLEAYSAELREKWQNADKKMLDALKLSKTLPENPLDVSTSPLENEKGLLDNLPSDLRVAFITAELKGVASVGGLGSALEGMIQGFGADYARVVMPLYRGEKNTIRQELILEMKPTDYEVYAEEKKDHGPQSQDQWDQMLFYRSPTSFHGPKGRCQPL